MCCRVTVTPPPPPDELAFYLRCAGFAPSEYPNIWRRYVAAEKTQVTVKLLTGKIELSLYPSVTAYHQHVDKREAASLMMQAAALLAEKTDALVTQDANVSACISESHPAVAIIAQYPGMHLAYANLCRGWQEVLIPHHEEGEGT